MRPHVYISDSNIGVTSEFTYRVLESNSDPTSSLSRENFSPALRKVINGIRGTHGSGNGFSGVAGGIIPFDQSIPESRITPQRESDLIGR